MILDILNQITTYLHQFTELEKEHAGPVSHSIQFDFKKHKAHVVFCAIIHGDEVGAIPALLDVINRLKTGQIKFGGKVTFFLGNVPAALQNKRFIEKDLNRSFDQHVTLSDTAERRRALSLMPLLKDCDLLFDFHQTARPSLYPFYAFGFDYQSYLWARIAGCTPMFVTRKSAQSFSAGGMCVDEYVRSFGRPAVTLELAQRGFTPLAKNVATLVMERVLKAADKSLLQRCHPTSKPQHNDVIPRLDRGIHFSIFNVNKLKKLAHKNRDLKFLLTVYKEPFSHPQKKLIDGLVNFSFVQKNQNLGTDENSHPILAPHSGFILFPKYPPRDAQGNSLEAQTELFILAQENCGLSLLHRE